MVGSEEILLEFEDFVLVFGYLGGGSMLESVTIDGL
jgi:hypothetical protein